MKFIIGHEFGHLQSQNAYFDRIIQFIFPNFEDVPMIFRNKITLWSKLSELTADRFGYIASQDLTKCISAFFKLSSGLSVDKIDFNINAYLKEMDNIIKRFKTEPFVSENSHPVNPIRIKALEYFSHSKIFKDALGQSNVVDKQLESKIEGLTDLLMVLADSKLDQQHLNFFASGGLLAAMADNDISELEIEKIVDLLSSRIMFPKVFLDSIVSKKEKIIELFGTSIDYMLTVRPSDRYLIINYLIDVILSDRKIDKKEVEFIYKVGKDFLGINAQEVAQIMRTCIQKWFVPSFYR